MAIHCGYVGVVGIYSIVITTVNHENVLRILDCLKTNYNSEIIVVDASETAWSDHRIHKHIRYKRSEPVARGINLGVNASTHEHVLYLNDDISIAGTEFDTLYQVFRNSNIPFLSPNIKEKDKLNPSGECGEIRKIVFGDDYIGRVFACVFMIKKIFQDVGGFDENLDIKYGDDVDFLSRAIKMGYSPYVTFDVEVKHK